MPPQLRCWTFMRLSPPIELTAEQRTTLEAWANGRKSQVRVAERARVVLLAAERRQSLEIAASLSISVQEPARLRWQFLAKGLPSVVLLCYRRRVPHSGQHGSRTASALATRIRKVAIDCGL